MQSFNELLSHGSGWFFIPTAVVLGALHGLEPGHSKTMMAAFIIAVRGTVAQAFLLGVAATVSHTAVIWVLAAIGLHFAGALNVEEIEPYLQFVSGFIIVALSAWMFNGTRRDLLAATAHSHRHHDSDGHTHNGHDHAHDHHHHHGHDHGGGHHHSHDHSHTPDEAHSHSHDHDHGHNHDHHHNDDDRHSRSEEEYQDDHEKAHAADFARRFPNQNVTTGQIILFGLTGGLMPCPAAFSILLLCLQAKQQFLGFGVVLAFSVGLAITLVSVGAAAATSVQYASRRFVSLGLWVRRLPYLSSGVLGLLGLYLMISSAWHIAARPS